jgi:hypothetical protein
MGCPPPKNPPAFGPEVVPADEGEGSGPGGRLTLARFARSSSADPPKRPLRKDILKSCSRQSCGETASQKLRSFELIQQVTLSEETKISSLQCVSQSFVASSLSTR